MDGKKDYIFHSPFNPIHGVDEDLHAFIRRFRDSRSIRFTKFSELWRREKFIHIIFGRDNQSGLCDILGCIFHRLVDLAQPKPNRSHLDCICSLYLLYAFHGKQPIRNQVRIRLSPDTWPGLLQLATEARDEGHLDVYYVFKQLCVSNAFTFSLTRQALYPSAPLFNSPEVKPNETSPTRTTSSEPTSSYLHLLRPPRTPHADLNDALRCLDTSVHEYTEVKKSLNPTTNDYNEPCSSKDNRNENEQVEDFLPGLNFITYPGSLQKLSGIVNNLNDLLNPSRKRKGDVIIIEDDDDGVQGSTTDSTQYSMDKRHELFQRGMRALDETNRIKTTSGPRIIPDVNSSAPIDEPTPRASDSISDFKEN